MIDFDEFRAVLAEYDEASQFQRKQEERNQRSSITGQSRNSNNNKKSRPSTARSKMSAKSTITLKRLETLGLLRPRTAQHHRKKSMANMPKNRKLPSKKPVKRGMTKSKPTYLMPLNRKWDIHSTNAYVHGNQPFAERHFSTYRHDTKKAI